MSDRLKFKVSQGADEVYAEKHDDGWYAVATRAGRVVQRYRMPVDSAEVDVFSKMRITLGLVRQGAINADG